MNSDDAEIVAMQELYRLMKPFDAAAQGRIAGYVGSRLAAEANAEDHDRWMAQQKECAAQQSLASALLPQPTAGVPLNYAIGRL